MIKWDTIEELGKIPDIDLAIKMNISPQAVFQARKRRNIIAKNPTPKYNINWDNVSLGKMTDQHIADIMGCSLSYVFKQRHKRGIPAFGMLYRTIENEAAYYEESIIDAWLHLHNIEHSFQHKIGKYRVDWLIISNNQIWEFLGMWDHKIYGEAYRKNFAIKEKFLKEQGYHVRAIHKTEIDDYKKEVDLTKIHEAVGFKCRGCERTNVRHHAKGMCSTCVGRIYDGRNLGPIKIKFIQPNDKFVCENCGSEDRHKRVKQKCRLCYAKARRLKK